MSASGATRKGGRRAGATHEWLARLHDKKSRGLPHDEMGFYGSEGRHITLHPARLGATSAHMGNWRCWLPHYTGFL